MSFSIVTIALNAAPELALTMESVLQQDFQDFEYIFIDGGSWDDTATVVRRYAGDLTRIVHLEDAGIYHAMNEAARHCSKEYVLFMNAKDRFFSKNVLSKFWASREEDPDFLFGDHVYVNGRTEHLTRAAVFESTRDLLRRGELTPRWQSGIPCHQATFTRTRVLREMGYDTRLEICADHDLMFRAYDAGARFQYVDEIAAFYMGGGYSAQRGERCRQEISYVYRRYSAAPAAVDRFFYGDGLVPFSPETSWTGVGLGGLSSPEPPEPGEVPARMARWCAAQTFEYLSPLNGVSATLKLKGENRLRGQRLTAMLDTRVLGATEVPEGAFDLEIGFSEPAPPGSLVRVFADRYGSEKGGGPVSVEIDEISMPLLQVVEGLSTRIGESRRFGLESGDKGAERMLLSGWSGMEPTHTWSLGQASNLLVSSPDRLGRIRLELAGNPHAPEASRYVDVLVNGTACGRFTLSLGPTAIEVMLKDSAWEAHGVNVVTLQPGLAAKPGGADTRPLGVCLYTLTVER